MNVTDTLQTVVIVGAGPIGTLNAIYFAKTKKFKVLLMEKRKDTRDTEECCGRSINLTLSARGIHALKYIGLDDTLRNMSVEVIGRMIHKVDGSLTRFSYTPDNKCIYAVKRKHLNETLLTEIERYKNITVKFQHDLTHVDFKEKVATFSNMDKDIKIKFDIIFGNDGANSMVRQEMMKCMKLNFSQEYIQHGYIELYFPAVKHIEPPMNKNYIHIWPRNEFMLIGLPNSDGSFTGTLFMPFTTFKSLISIKKLLNFFQDNFSDALKFIGESRLVETFFANKPSSMVTIKCSPSNYKDSSLLMGDAAHAMVPFYGQGLNTGFEDVSILHEMLLENNYDLNGCLNKFSNERYENVVAICDLSLLNFVELRKTVNSKLFKIRKNFDNLMNRIFPSYWIPIYTMVAFDRTPYSKCLQERKKQDKIFSIIELASLICFIGVLCFGIKDIVFCFL